jgi:biopolymer transport protein TolQ
MNNLILTVAQQGVGRSTNYLEIIAAASPIVKLVLLMLLVFSIVSWAIIIFKLVEYANAKKNSLRFIDYFRKTKNFSEINKFAALFQNNPLASIFKNGYRELTHQMSANKDQPGERLNHESIHRSLMRASTSEITRLERLNGFLATTAAVTPFIGLFGTVWGIMSAFHEIGVQMNANLTTVAPGIAEALIATALGLFAAIPAVIFYNLLLNKLKVLISEMEEFILEFLNVSEKIR